MTLESMHFSEITPAEELSGSEVLIIKKLDVHQEIGRLSLQLCQLNAQLNAKILESIQLNTALTEAGVDKHELARMIHTPRPGEESLLFGNPEPRVTLSQISNSVE